MSRTLHLVADDPANVRRAASILRGGGLVAFPTETVYGLGANALSAAAVAGIFRAKQRPSWDPLIVHVVDQEAVAQVASVSGPNAERVDVLARAFWPGPLTMLLPRSSAVPDSVTAGRPLVGVRVPAHPAALALLRAVGLPVAAPSANRFGHTSPTTAQHVLDDLDGRIDAVLDGGPCSVGVESTVLDPLSTPMVVYRAGAVTVETLANVTGVETVHYEPSPESGKMEPPASLPSPGVGLRHYAPLIPVQLAGGSSEALRASIIGALASGGRIGVLLPTDWPSIPEPDVRVQPWAAWSEPEALAAHLFAGLRALEHMDVSRILCPLPQPGGMNDAVRDRLLKAAKTA